MRSVKSGFTIMEVMVVISIISLLASIFIASYKNSTDKARIAGALLFSNSINGVLSDSLYAYWPMDELNNSGVTPDMSGNGLNAAITNYPSPGSNTADPTLVPNAIIRGGISFPGQRILSVANFKPPPKGTVSFWFITTVDKKQRPLGAHGDYETVILDNSGGSDLKNLENQFFTDRSTNFNGTTEITINKWHHGLLVYDSTIEPEYYAVYLDGKLENSIYPSNFEPNPVIMSIDTTTLYLGMTFGNTSANERFVGILDEVRIFSQSYIP